MRFTHDHEGFYRDGVPFTPCFDEGKEGVWIRLAAHLKDELNWDGPIKKAKDAVDEGKYILFEIDLGLDVVTFSPQDSAAFFSYSLAMEEFEKKVFPLFREHLFGVVVYRGPLPTISQFPMHLWERAFCEWRKNQEAYEVFCMQVFSEYLHRLISFLPESLLAFAMFDIQQMPSLSLEAQLLSKVRFEYVHLILKGARIPFSGLVWDEKGCRGQMENADVGLYLPQDSDLDPDALVELDVLMLRLYQNKVSYRILPEEKLTELWNGIDVLIALPHTVGSQGKRKLQGFCAAGGAVVEDLKFLYS